jgi:hypothetical protein
LFSGFRGTHQPPAPPIHGLEDNMPDVHDEADFDIHDIHAVLERFMTDMSKLADVEYQALSDLLDSLSLPDPSRFTTAKSMTAAAARVKSVISGPEADEETLREFSPSEMKLYRHATSDLQELHRKSVSLLELLLTHLPDRVCGALSFSAGHDEPLRFASALCGEVPLI